MALSNTAVPRYYGKFREAVIRGEIPVCKEISMEMNRIDDLIANPGIYYDDKAVEGWIKYCEAEMTLTDGSDLHLLDSFKLWGEQVFGWYYFVERTVYEPNADGRGGHYVKKMIKKRLVNKQYLIVGRGAAKSIYDSCIQSFFENVDTSTTHQITTAPTMKLAEDRMLLFDEELMTYAMGNCIAMEDTNGNRKLMKKRYEQKIDAVSAMMDAYIAYKRNPEAFE